MEFEARDASQAAQQANVEFYSTKSWHAKSSRYGGRTLSSTTVFQNWGDARLQRKKQDRERRLRRLEFDRRGDGQLAQEASREAPMENEPEPALVLARLRAMRAGTTPSLDVLYSAIFRGVPFRPRN